MTWDCRGLSDTWQDTIGKNMNLSPQLRQHRSTIVQCHLFLQNKDNNNLTPVTLLSEAWYYVQIYTPIPGGTFNAERRTKRINAAQPRLYNSGIADNVPLIERSNDIWAPPSCGLSLSRENFIVPDDLLPARIPSWRHCFLSDEIDGSRHSPAAGNQQSMVSKVGRYLQS